MMALVKTAKGEGHLELREVPKPSVRTGHVLIRPEAVGICGSDLARYTGKLVDYEPPVVLGHEFSGTIAEVGENVTQLSPGDRIVCETHGTFCGSCYFCMTGQHALCSARKGIGYGVDGAYAEYVLARAEMAHLMPSSLEFEEAALTDTLTVALHAVADRARLEPGNIVVIFGMGPVGLLALQVAKLYGPSKVIAVDLSENVRLKMARDLGADHTIAAGSQDVIGAIHEQTDGKGADVCIDTAGSRDALDVALHVTKPSGQVVVVGTHGKPEEIDVERMVTKQLAMIGSWSHTWMNCETALQLLAARKVSTRILITHTFPLKEWKKAFEILLNLQGVKAILKP
jgi:L-iditol 2-dehydrogenase